MHELLRFLYCPLYFSINHIFSTNILIWTESDLKVFSHWGNFWNYRFDHLQRLQCDLHYWMSEMQSQASICRENKRMSDGERGPAQEISTGWTIGEAQTVPAFLFKWSQCQWYEILCHWGCQGRCFHIRSTWKILDRQAMYHHKRIELKQNIARPLANSNNF